MHLMHPTLEAVYAPWHAISFSSHVSGICLLLQTWSRHTMQHKQATVTLGGSIHCSIYNTYGYSIRKRLLTHQTSCVRAMELLRITGEITNVQCWLAVAHNNRFCNLPPSGMNRIDTLWMIIMKTTLASTCYNRQNSHVTLRSARKANATPTRKKRSYAEKSEGKRNP